MSKAISTFLSIAVLVGVLTALGITVAQHGYPFGALGVQRLDNIAGGGTFIPLAAVYFAAAAMLMILPIRAAAFVLQNAAEPLYWTVVVLFAAIVGHLAAQAALGQTSILWSLLNWQFLFAAAVVGVHLLLNELRRNVLLRTLAFIGFTAASLACLFWSFRL